MARRAAAAAQVTLYRLLRKANTDLSHLIQSKYLNDEFELRPTAIGDVPCLLTFGFVGKKESPPWVQHVRTLTGTEVALENRTAAGLLLVPLEEFAFALSWGMGFLLLDQNYIDLGFGLRFTIRLADPDKVRSITMHALDTLPRTAKTSVLGGAKLGAFGMEELGEVLSRLVGRVPAQGLSCDRQDRKTWITVRGSDALGLPLGKTPELLLSDLHVINNVVENLPPVLGLEHLEDTRPLRPGSDLINGLDAQLSLSLYDGAPLLALSWPSGWDDERGEASKYQLSNFVRSSNGISDELELLDLIIPLEDHEPERRLTILKRARIQGLRNDDQPVSQAISADKWLTFEHIADGHRYVYHRGQWYDIGSEYLTRLHEKIGRILAKGFDYELPAWPLTQKMRKKDGELYADLIVEGHYNLLAALNSDGKLLCLDRKMIQSEQHPRGFESCDLLGPKNELIHVKRLDDSVSASHLFNQALVSAEALRRQVDAGLKFRERVLAISEGKRIIPDDYRPQKVVLAFAGKVVTPEDLFTFSQVSLHRLALRMDEVGVSLEIAQIASSEELISAEELAKLGTTSKAKSVDG